MPGFSENPQPEQSGKKSEKPKKRELDDDTLEGVSESVREGKGKEEKSDIEKLKNQESYEEVYEVEIDGETYEIPVQVSYFEYPEHIQENTGGVLGYERKRVSFNDISKIFDIDIPPEYPYSEFISKIPIRIMNELTEGQFPGETHNHSMGRMLNDPNRKVFQDINSQERFSLQKIFNPTSIIKWLEEVKGEDIPVALFLDLVFMDVSTNEEVDRYELGHADIKNKTRCENIIEEIKAASQKSELYNIADIGLSVTNKGLYRKNSRQHSPTFNSPIYGFSRDNYAFKKYLKKAKKIFQSGPVSEKINREKKQDIPMDVLGPEGDGFKGVRKQIQTIGYFLEDGIDNLERWKKDPAYRGFRHPWIPIINDHPNIPDLRWCHAEYGYIPTEKNLNVLRFISEDMEEESESGKPESDES